MTDSDGGVVYHLVAVEPYDGKSWMRILMGVILLLGLLCALIAVSIAYDAIVLFAGIPVMFLLTYLVGSVLNTIFFPRKLSEISLALSSEKIVLTTGKEVREIPNTNLVYSREDESSVFTVTNPAGMLEIPVAFMADPRVRQGFPKHAPLGLVVRKGKLMVVSGFFRNRFYHYESF